MDDLRLHAVVARVVAWHNRHPLARRITAAQVNSVGYVALPYTAPGLLPQDVPAPPAPPPPEATVPAAQPAEPDAINPVVEAEDPHAVVIEIDPAPQIVDGDDSAASAPELPDATPQTDAPPAPQSTPEAASATDDSADDSAGDSAGASEPAAMGAAAPAAAAGSSLRARATASEGQATQSPQAAPPAATLAPDAPCTLVCSDDFMAPLPLKQVLDWVRTHGLALLQAPLDGPVRQVPVDAALLPTGAGVAQLWVATAAIEIGGQRHRLLLGGGELPAVLGRRAWSRPRLLGALAAPAGLVAAVVGLMWPVAPSALPAPSAPSAPAAALPAVAVATAPAASATSAASAPSAASAARAASIVATAASASAPEASNSAVAVTAKPQHTSADPPRLPGLLDDAAKAQARATVAALRAERQASAPAKQATAAGTAATAATAVSPPAAATATPPATQPAAPPAVLYGLSTRLLRTRAEAEQLQSAFQALLGGTRGSLLRVEMLPVGEDWRVVCWPYERRADAERARALLQARGMKVELVDF